MINFLRSVDVQANASGNHIDSSIEASASAQLAAESILMQGNVDVTASANGFDAESIDAHANLIAEGFASNRESGSSGNLHRNAASSINFLGTVDVQANANGSNVWREIEATASAQFYGNFITVAGEATVKATANHSGSSVDSVRSRAKLVAAEGLASYFDGSTANVHTLEAFSINFAERDRRGGLDQWPVHRQHRERQRIRASRRRRYHGQRGRHGAGQ